MVNNEYCRLIVIDVGRDCGDDADGSGWEKWCDTFKLCISPTLQTCRNARKLKPGSQLE